MKPFVVAAAVWATLWGPVQAETYAIDTTHAQVLFSYDHLGFSTTYGLLSGITGEIELVAEDPAASSVRVEIPLSSLASGDAGRDTHLLGADFFGVAEHPVATFQSTSIEVTGEQTALITGDLTLNGVTRPVTLDTRLTQIGTNPIVQMPWAGFVASASLLRSDFGMGAYAPFISDEVALQISIEAVKQQ